MDAMLGLVIVALGLVTLVLAFLIAEPKKRIAAYVIAGIVSVSGLYYYVGSEMRGFQMKRRIADIQRQQQVNLEEIQKKLRESQGAQGKPMEAPAAPKAK
jgi:uncharacterized membrane protein